MAGAVWRPLLGTLGPLLAAASGEALVVQLLKVPALVQALHLGFRVWARWARCWRPPPARRSSCSCSRCLPS